MKLKREKNLSDFVSYRGEYSSGRLISLVGSTVVLILLIINPTNSGLQQLTMAVLGYSFASTTVSKFAKKESFDNSNQYNYGNESTGTEEVWPAEPEQPQFNSVGRTNRIRNRVNPEEDLLQ